MLIMCFVLSLSSMDLTREIYFLVHYLVYLFVEYILENRVKMAVSSGMVFAPIYLTKATEPSILYMNMRCNKVLLM